MNVREIERERCTDTLSSQCNELICTPRDDWRAERMKWMTGRGRKLREGRERRRGETRPDHDDDDEDDEKERQPFASVFPSSGFVT